MFRLNSMVSKRTRLIGIVAAALAVAPAVTASAADRGRDRSPAPQVRHDDRDTRERSIDNDRREDRDDHYDYDRHDDRRVDATRQVWVEPVYRPVTDHVWVAPVTRIECEKVWVKPTYKTALTVGAPILRKVEATPGHWEERQHEVVVAPGHYEDVCRQELVTPGHWETVCDASPAPRHDDDRAEARIDFHFPW